MKAHMYFTMGVKKNHMTKDKNILLLFHNLWKQSAQDNFLPCHRILMNDVEYNDGGIQIIGCGIC